MSPTSLPKGVLETGSPGAPIWPLPCTSPALRRKTAACTKIIKSDRVCKHSAQHHGDVKWISCSDYAAPDTSLACHCQHLCCVECLSGTAAPQLSVLQTGPDTDKQFKQTFTIFFVCHEISLFDLVCSLFTALQTDRSSLPERQSLGLFPAHPVRSGPCLHAWPFQLPRTSQCTHASLPLPCSISQTPVWSCTIGRA